MPLSPADDWATARALQADIGPDGRLHVIYAKRLPGEPLVNRVASSDTTLLFGAGIPRNGPQP